MAKVQGGDNYKGYAKRIYSLWKNRRGTIQKRYIVGKTLDEKELRR
jgi:hypothetical protein